MIDLVHARYEEREKGFGDGADAPRRALPPAERDRLQVEGPPVRDRLAESGDRPAGLRPGRPEDRVQAARATELFEEKLLPAIEDEVSSLILRIQIGRPQAAGDAAQAPAASPQEGGAPALTPRGMVQGTGAAAPTPTPEQVDAYRREMRRRQAQQLMRSSVPATSAFDVMRRRQTLAAAREASEAATKEAASSAEPGAAPREGAAKPQPQPQPQPARAEPPVPAAGRNDLCPCGSGKKFKKCHGKA